MSPAALCTKDASPAKRDNKRGNLIPSSFPNSILFIITTCFRRAIHLEHPRIGLTNSSINLQIILNTSQRPTGAVTTRRTLKEGKSKFVSNAGDLS